VRILAALLLLVSLVGCAGSPPAPPTHGSSDFTLTDSPPVRVRVPAIGVDSSLMSTGINPDGTIEVPPDNKPEQASYFDKAPNPGQKGPAVILGHINGGGKEGIFFRLHEVVAGDIVIIDRADGSELTFSVTDTAEVPKNKFPTEQVYGDLPYPGIRLISCGGDLNEDQHTYADNIIVLGRLYADGVVSSDAKPN
jgi:hypothetical protein